LTLWQCAAKVISAFWVFAVLVLRVNDCRPYTPFKLLSFFYINTDQVQFKIAVLVVVYKCFA